MKASLSMKHGIIPPNLHFNEISPTVAPFYNNLNLVSSLQPWPEVPTGEPRRASVNSFGMPVENLFVEYLQQLLTLMDRIWGYQWPRNHRNLSGSSAKLGIDYTRKERD
jgi:hypothetical protein